MSTTTTTTDNGTVLDMLNAAVKAKSERASAARDAHLKARADLREAVTMRDKVYEMLGLQVPDDNGTDDDTE